MLHRGASEPVESVNLVVQRINKENEEEYLCHEDGRVPIAPGLPDVCHSSEMRDVQADQGSTSSFASIAT